MTARSAPQPTVPADVSDAETTAPAFPPRPKSRARAARSRAEHAATRTGLASPRARVAVKHVRPSATPTRAAVEPARVPSLKRVPVDVYRRGLEAEGQPQHLPDVRYEAAREAWRSFARTHGARRGVLGTTGGTSSHRNLVTAGVAAAGILLTAMWLWPAKDGRRDRTVSGPSAAISTASVVTSPSAEAGTSAAPPVRSIFDTEATWSRAPAGDAAAFDATAAVVDDADDVHAVVDAEAVRRAKAASDAKTIRDAAASDDTPALAPRPAAAMHDARALAASDAIPVSRLPPRPIAKAQPAASDSATKLPSRSLPKAQPAAPSAANVLHEAKPSRARTNDATHVPDAAAAPTTKIDPVAVARHISGWLPPSVLALGNGEGHARSHVLPSLTPARAAGVARSTMLAAKPALEGIQRSLAPFAFSSRNDLHAPDRLADPRYAVAPEFVDPIPHAVAGEQANAGAPSDESQRAHTASLARATAPARGTAYSKRQLAARKHAARAQAIPAAAHVMPEAVMPLDQPLENLQAFESLPKTQRDLNPLGGIGEGGIYVDRLALGSVRGGKHCNDQPDVFVLDQDRHVQVCIRVVHPRTEQRVTVLWKRGDEVVRRMVLPIASQHGYRTRARMALRDGYEGQWNVVIVSDDGVELGRSNFEISK